MKLFKRKPKREREPGLLKKLIMIYYEQAKRRKALREMQKLSWSFDFLALLLVKASKAAGQGLTMEITDKSGVKINVTYDQAKASGVIDRLDDSIFNKLDDDAAIEDFILRNSTR